MTKFLLPLLALALASCGTTKTVEVYKEVPVPVAVYPALDDLDKLEGRFPVEDVEFDIPRDMSARPALRPGCTGEIVNYAADDPCLIYPPVPLSNVYLGMNQENWIKFQVNLERLVERNRLRDTQIEEVNKQREEWRRKNAEALEELKQ